MCSLNTRDMLFSDRVRAFSRALFLSEPGTGQNGFWSYSIGLKWICHGFLVHFGEIRFLIPYRRGLPTIRFDGAAIESINVNEEITRNRQNHSLLPNRIYLPSIKSNGYNKMDLKNSYANTEVYESHNLRQVRPCLCFYRRCYLFGFFNVLNRYLFCFTQFQWWQFLLLEFLENSWLSSLKFAFPLSKPCVFSRNLSLSLSCVSTSFTGPFPVVLLTLVDNFFQPCQEF